MRRRGARMHYRSPIPFAQGAAAQPTDGYAQDDERPSMPPSYPRDDNDYGYRCIHCDGDDMTEANCETYEDEPCAKSPTGKHVLPSGVMMNASERRSVAEYEARRLPSGVHPWEDDGSEGGE